MPTSSTDHWKPSWKTLRTTTARLSSARRTHFRMSRCAVRYSGRFSSSFFAPYSASCSRSASVSLVLRLGKDAHFSITSYCNSFHAGAEKSCARVRLSYTPLILAMSSRARPLTSSMPSRSSR